MRIERPPVGEVSDLVRDAGQVPDQVAARVRWVNRRVYVDLAGMVKNEAGRVMVEPFAVVELSTDACTRIMPILVQAERAGDAEPPPFFVDATAIMPEALEEWAVDTVELWWQARTVVEGAGRR